MYQPNDGVLPTQCESCQPGMAVNKAGPGMFGLRFEGGVASFECEDCKKGQYQNEVAGERSKFGCFDCKTGYFAADKKSVNCSECGRGQFVEVEGALACEDCPKGTFQLHKGKQCKANVLWFCCCCCCCCCCYCFVVGWCQFQDLFQFLFHFFVSILQY